MTTTWRVWIKENGASSWKDTGSTAFNQRHAEAWAQKVQAVRPFDTVRVIGFDENGEPIFPRLAGETDEEHAKRVADWKLAR